MGREDVLSAHIILRDTLRPNAALRVFELVKKGFFIGLVVLVYDHFGFLVPFCHCDGSTAEDGNAADAFLGEHVVQHRSAYEAGCACEYEMHVCFVSVSMLGVLESCGVNCSCAVSSK